MNQAASQPFNVDVLTAAVDVAESKVDSAEGVVARCGQQWLHWLASLMSVTTGGVVPCCAVLPCRLLQEWKRSHDKELRTPTPSSLSVQQPTSSLVSVSAIVLHTSPP
jgi:hypothetical protein